MTTNVEQIRNIITTSLGTAENPGPMMPIFLEGPPGVGKTSVIEQIAKDLGIGYCFLPCSNLRPEDLSVPDVIQAGTLYDYKVFKGLPVVGNDSVPERGIICMDELPQGMDPVQQFCSQFMPPNSAAGTHKAKPGWLVVATGNRREDKAGAKRLLSHLLDRMVLIEDVMPSLDEWLTYNRKSGQDNPMVVAFHKQTEGRYLYTFEGGASDARKAATMRGWTNVSRFLNTDLSPGAMGLVAKGIVGEAAAAQFQAFLSLASEIPNVDECLSSKQAAETVVLPTGMAKRWFMSSAVSLKATAANAAAVMVLLKRLSGEGHEDMLVASLLSARGTSFSSSTEYQDAILSGMFDGLEDVLGM